MASRPVPSRTRAGDVLPAAVLIEAVRREAFMACAARALDLPWPPGVAAHNLIDRAPLVALAALEGFCPGVPLDRLARCLRLHPIQEPEALGVARGGAAWPADALAATVAAVRSQFMGLDGNQGGAGG